MVGTDLRNDTDELNNWALELLAECGVVNFLEKDDFVFMMHQGYMFWYFKADGNANPDVYFYHEGRLLPNKEFPLKEFLNNYPKRLCDLTNKETEWEKQLRFYDDLDNMLELIGLLKQEGFCDKFFPSNSHDALGLSKVFDDFKFENSMVYIQPRPDKTFEIHYQTIPGKTVEIETTKNIIAIETIRKIEKWLERKYEAQHLV